MGLIREIPKRSIYIPTVNRFSAAFNVPAVGQYDFGVPANQDVIVMRATRGMVYWLDRVSFTATAADGDYLSAISMQPTLKLSWQQDGATIFSRPFPLVNYRDGQECNTVMETTKGNEHVLASVSGVLNQIPNWIGIGAITLQVSLDVYEIHDLNFLSAWRDNTHAGIGRNLVQ